MIYREEKIDEIKSYFNYKFTYDRDLDKINLKVNFLVDLENGLNDNTDQGSYATDEANNIENDQIDLKQYTEAIDLYYNTLKSKKYAVFRIDSEILKAQVYSIEDFYKLIIKNTINDE